MNKFLKILTIAALICALAAIPALAEEGQEEIPGWNPVDGFTGIFKIEEKEKEPEDLSSGITTYFAAWGPDTETYTGEEIIIPVNY